MHISAQSWLRRMQVANSLTCSEVRQAVAHFSLVSAQCHSFSMRA
ncbi:hypothetical protein [Parapedobacter koreensis]|nr:hypothetical protein [Parapedobacter koreensis]